MLSAFGWKTQASHMSFKLTIDRMPISIKKEYESTDAFIENAIDMSRLESLSSITDIKVYTPEDAIKEGLLSENYLNERNQANLETYRLMYGADELVDRMITFKLGQELYGFAPFIARFGDRWYLYSMDMLGFLRLRAWDAQREQEKKKPRQRFIDEVWPGVKPGT